MTLQDTFARHICKTAVFEGRAAQYAQQTVEVLYRHKCHDDCKLQA